MLLPAMCRLPEALSAHGELSWPGGKLNIPFNSYRATNLSRSVGPLKLVRLAYKLESLRLRLNQSQLQVNLLDGISCHVCALRGREVLGRSQTWNTDRPKLSSDGT
jgi:hypothetical protein